MKILISAAEASSDLHGAALLRALRAEAGEPIEAMGIGGPGLVAEGLGAIVDARGLLSMGFFEIFWKLPRFARALGKLTRAARSEQPAVAVLIDYPDFHLRLAARLNRLGIPVVSFIPPKVWVWRRSRIALLRERFARVLCIFPFEVELLVRGRVPAVYVGNPLVDELPLKLSRAEARRELGLAEQDRVLAILPGSRPAELRHHLIRMLEAARLSALKLRASGWLAPGKELRVVIPLSSATDAGPVAERAARWVASHRELPLTVEVKGGGSSALALLAADGALVKSGTSTLEAGILLCPHVVAYRPNWLSAWIFHTFIKYPGPIGLVNLVGGYFGKPRSESPVPELICEEVTEQAMADALVPLLSDALRRESILKFLNEVRARVLGTSAGTPRGMTGSPSRLAALEVLQVMKEAKTGKVAAS